jgi:hypothetical protein
MLQCSFTCYSHYYKFPFLSMQWIVYRYCVFFKDRLLVFEALNLGLIHLYLFYFIFILFLLIHENALVFLQKCISNEKKYL